MNKHKSLAVNVGLNVVRTILSLVSPLITYPYVSRVLGADNLGSVNYTLSIVQYFILFSGLGISTYGIREGAKKRDNKPEVSRFLCECFTINVIFTIIAYLIFIVLLVFAREQRNYFYLFCIQSFLILFSTIGLEWVNTVFEDYFFITIRTIIVQVLNIILSFLLIQSRSDYLLYALITVITNGLISILNWFHFRKEIIITITKKPNIRKHFKPIIVFFANKLAITLYVSADTTMLGAMIGDYSVGVYSVAVKIYIIIKNILGAVYAVFLPRLSYTNNNENREQFKKIYSDLISTMTLLILPISVGLLVLSRNIIVLLFGVEYEAAKSPLAILCLALAFSIYGGVVSGVYDIVKGLEKIVLRATVLAAIINIGLNLFIIPKYKEIGAAYTTLVAEMFTFVYCLFRSKDIKKFLDVRMIIKNSIHSIIGCFEIVVIVSGVSKLISVNWLICTISIGVSVLIYLLTLILLKNTYVISFIKKIFRIEA